MGIIITRPTVIEIPPKVFISRNGNRINSDNYRERLKQIAKELGIEDKIRTHGLRKYYETQLNTLKDDKIIRFI